MSEHFGLRLLDISLMGEISDTCAAERWPLLNWPDGKTTFDSGQQRVCVLPVVENDFRRGHELSPLTLNSLISDQAWWMNPTTKVTLLPSRFSSLCSAAIRLPPSLSMSSTQTCVHLSDTLEIPVLVPPLIWTSSEEGPPGMRPGHRGSTWPKHAFVMVWN